jgi:hypothetical protein
MPNPRMIASRHCWNAEKAYQITICRTPAKDMNFAWLLRNAARNKTPVDACAKVNDPNDPDAMKKCLEANSYDCGPQPQGC